MDMTEDENAHEGYGGGLYTADVKEALINRWRPVPRTSVISYGAMRRVSLFLLLFLAVVVSAQQTAVFRIQPVKPVEELRKEALASQPPVEKGEFRRPDLTELVKLDPTIKLDIRYAGTDNFLSTPMYS